MKGADPSTFMELNKRSEVLALVAQAEGIQDRLKTMQNENLDFEKVYEFFDKEKA